MAIFWNTHARITPAVAEAHIAELLSISPPLMLSTPFTPTSSSNADIQTDASVPTRAALDTPDEFALRALLLGTMHRVAGYPAEARVFLRDARAQHENIPTTGSTWIGGVALFELAVLELHDAQRLEYEDAATRRSNTNEMDSISSSSSSEDGNSVNGILSHKAPAGVYDVGGGVKRVVAGARGLEDLHIHVGAVRPGESARARWVKSLKEAGTLLDAAMSLSGSEVDLSSRLESRVAMLRDEIALKREMIGQR